VGIPPLDESLTMTYAIVKTGGKQYRVEPGVSIVVEKIKADEGSTVELDEVLMISDDSSTTIGTPLVEGAKVVAEVETQAKGDKIIVLKYKRKTRHAVKNGHRQRLTKLAIKEIVTGAALAGGKRAADGA
jgi:large subunit ribosomal protein L21